MIRTVLGSETYLFSPREAWVLNQILDLPCKSRSRRRVPAADKQDEPKYLLTRLLLRQPGKVHSYADLVPRYSPELGEEGVLNAAKQLNQPLPVPEEIRAVEPQIMPAPTPLQPTKSYPTPQSNPRPRGKRKPWSDLPTGLSADEENADPELAEAIRESLWASKVGRVEIDDDGEVVKSISPSTSASRSQRSTPVSPSSDCLPSVYAEEFSLSPKPDVPIVGFSKAYTDMSLDNLMSCIPADELRRLARARKVPAASLLNRDATVRALKKVATEQTTLTFTPLGKGKAAPPKQATLPFTPNKTFTATSESLLVAALLPPLGGGAIQLTPELHSLIARVNLLFSRTPPLTATSASLMLPSILVTSHKRRYPEYGPPTRSRIWQNREDLLKWERVVYWEGLVADALGDTWAEQKRNPVPGFGLRRDTLSRTEGARVVRRVWEGIWPTWNDMVAGDGGQVVDVLKEQGGLVGDRFKLGESRNFVSTSLTGRTCID